MTQLVYFFTEWLAQSFWRELLGFLVVAAIAFPYKDPEDDDFPGLASYIVVLVLALVPVFINPVSSKILLQIIYFGYAIPSLIFSILASIAKKHKDLEDEFDKTNVYTFLNIWVLFVFVMIWRNLDSSLAFLDPYKSAFLSYWFDFVVIGSMVFGVTYYFFYTEKKKYEFDFAKFLKIIPLISFVCVFILSYDFSVQAKLPFLTIAVLASLMLSLLILQLGYRKRREPCQADSFSLLEKKALSDKYYVDNSKAIKILTTKYAKRFEKPNQKLLKGVFLRSEYTDVKKEAIKTINNKKFLAKVAKNNEEYKFRYLAIKKLGIEDTQESIMDIAKNDSNATICKEAINKIETQEQLKEIVLSAKKFEAQQYAISKITDQQMLEGIALKSDVAGLRKEAVKQISSQEVLYQVVLGDKSKEVAAVAVAKITDLQMLEKIAVESKMPTIQKTAVKKVDNQDVLYQISMNGKNIEVAKAAFEKIEDLQMIESIAVKCKLPAIQKIAIKKVENQDVLYQIGINDKNIEVATAAVGKITDLQMIENLALESNFPRIRKKAIEKVDNQKLLYKISLQDNGEGVAKAASSKLNDIELIHEVLAKTKKAEVREALVVKVKDENILVGIAEKDPNSNVRSRALKKLKDVKVLAGLLKNEKIDHVRKDIVKRTMELIKNEDDEVKKDALVIVLDYLFGLTKRNKAKEVPFPIVAPYADIILDELIENIGSPQKEKRKFIKKVLIGASHSKRKKVIEKKVFEAIGNLHDNAKTRLEEVLDRWGDAQIPGTINISSRFGWKW